MQLFISLQQWLYSDSWARFPSVWVIHWPERPPHSLLLPVIIKLSYESLLFIGECQLNSLLKREAAKLCSSYNPYPSKTSPWLSCITISLSDFSRSAKFWKPTVLVPKCCRRYWVFSKSFISYRGLNFFPWINLPSSIGLILFTLLCFCGFISQFICLHKCNSDLLKLSSGL